MNFELGSWNWADAVPGGFYELMSWTGAFFVSSVFSFSLTASLRLQGLVLFYFTLQVIRCFA